MIVVKQPTVQVVDVVSAYSAACALRSFTGTVGPKRLHAMLTRAGVDPRWLVGERWTALEGLWKRGASADQARVVLAGFSD